MSPEAAFVLELLDREGHDLRGATTEIAPGDAMYRFALAACRGAAAPARLEYFASAAAGYRVAAAVLTAQAATDPQSDPAVLDFGCGHGRVSRLLDRRLAASGEPRSGLWAVEADPDAVDFVRDRLGIPAVVGPHEPSALRLPADAPGTFSTVLALSVLSHLPPARFDGWLRRWLELLRPGGLLVASVLGAGTMLPGRTMPEDGAHFEAMSESDVLATDEYGTTWIDDRFLAARLAAASDGRARWRVFERGLWQLQDVVAVAVDERGEAALERLGESFPAAPGGRLEGAETTDDDGLRLTGWAVVGRGERAATVEAWVGDRCRTVVATDPRADVAAHLDLPPTSASWATTPGGTVLGFTLELPGPIDPRDVLSLVARDRATGIAHPLWLGPTESASLFCALRRTADERDAARNALAVVEASRFGRARRGWLALKRRLGR